MEATQGNILGRTQGHQVTLASTMYIMVILHKDLQAIQAIQTTQDIQATQFIIANFPDPTTQARAIQDNQDTLVRDTQVKAIQGFQAQVKIILVATLLRPIQGTLDLDILAQVILVLGILDQGTPDQVILDPLTAHLVTLAKATQEVLVTLAQVTQEDLDTPAQVILDLDIRATQVRATQVLAIHPATPDQDIPRLVTQHQVILDLEDTPTQATLDLGILAQDTPDPVTHLLTPVRVILDKAILGTVTQARTTREQVIRGNTWGKGTLVNIQANTPASTQGILGIQSVIRVILVAVINPSPILVQIILHRGTLHPHHTVRATLHLQVHTHQVTPPLQARAHLLECT